jgi:amidase
MKKQHCNRKSMGPVSAVALAAIVLIAAPGNAQQAPAFDPFETTIPQIEAALSAGTISCTQLVQWYVDRMDAFDIAGPKLNAVRVRNPKALQIAASYDQMPKAQRPGPLFCVPMVVKDNIDTVDMPTTAGSVALQGTFPIDDNLVVKKLKAAGAIIIAKGNLTEFANYLTTGMPAGFSSLGGYVLNPYDARPIPVPLANSDGRQALSPSGSSSGPAVVSAANLAAAAIGTETSGSILSPANANSDVGIKPTVGLISRQGVVPIAASQDTAGPDHANRNRCGDPSRRADGRGRKRSRYDIQYRARPFRLHSIPESRRAERRTHRRAAGILGYPFRGAERDRPGGASGDAKPGSYRGQRKHPIVRSA